MDDPSEHDGDSWWLENCAIIPPDFSKVILVGVVGAIVAAVSVVFNTFLFCVLCRNRRHRHSHVVYLIFLALADIFLSAAYIMIFPVNVYMDFFDSEFLAMAWYYYMRSMITVSHVFISASAFLICAAAFERYVTISKLTCQFARHHRLIICLVSLLIAVITKMPMYIEMEVVPNQNCTGATSLTVIPSAVSESEPYKTVYKYWIRNVVTIFLPFIVCFCLNFAIIRRLRVQHKGAKLFRFATSEHRQNIRSATLMLVSVTCTCLASNLLNVIVYTWELIDKDSLLSEEYRPFYTLSSDLVSLLTVLASACRLPIYFLCNARIRCEVLDYIDSCVLANFNIKPYSEGSDKTRARATTVRYCDTGSGFMIYEVNSKKGEPRLRSVGTGLDKIVLSVAMGSMSNRNLPANNEQRLFLDVHD